MLALLSGLSAGALHVVSGPDHLAAMGPLTVDQRTRGAVLGASWGAGHGGGVVALATLALLLRSRFNLSAISARAELAVGFLLIGMGLWSLLQPPHRHAPRSREPKVAFMVGLLHGTAGAGHLLGALPTLGLSGAAALVYLSAYVSASMATMTGVGWLLANTAARLQTRRLRALRYASGGLAVGVGLLWVARNL